LRAKVEEKIAEVARFIARKRAEELASAAHEKAPGLSTGGSFSSSDDSQN
jgi:hypothetical protein